MEPQLLGDPFGKCGSVWHYLASMASVVPKPVLRP